MDGCDLPLFIVDGLVQRLQLFLDPLVSLLLGGELTATALLGIQVGPLLRGLGESGQEVRYSLGRHQPFTIMKQKPCEFHRSICHFKTHK